MPRLTAMRESGFSFVEIIVAIVIMGILSIGLVQFIMDSASGYSVTATRNQVSASGRVVIDRMAMELHNALPESVRVTAPLSAANQTAGLGFEGDQCLEFLPVDRATTYLTARFRPAAANANPFSVVDFVPTLDPLPFTDHYAVIYPTGVSDLYKDSYTDTEAIIKVEVNDSNGSDGKNELTPQVSHRFKRRSAVDRLFLVADPISFCVSGNKLYRYTGYGFATTQMVPLEPDDDCTAGIGKCLPASTPDRVLITDQLGNGALVGAQAFDVEPTTRRRNAVIQLELLFAQDGEEVRLNHEIMQQATP